MEKSVLKNLVMLPSPSGFEFMTEDYIRSLEFTKEYIFEKDSIGNQYFWSKKDSPGDTVMISAHIDEIGLAILGKTESGLYRVQKIGGMDMKVLEGQVVWCYPDPIKNPEKKLEGVIGKIPIHLETQKNREKVEELTDILVDFGDLPESEEPKVGSPIVFKKHFTELPGDLISAPGLDDKAGAWIVLDLMDRFKDQNDLDYNLVFVLTTQEEVGLRGAKIAAKRINPTISIDIDVSFAVDEGRGGNKIPGGSIKLGNGPILTYGPDKDFKLMKELHELATKDQETVSVAGGTNTAAIQLNSDNCRTALISIPQRNMHTPVEVCSWIDLTECSEIIAKYLLTL